MHEAVQRMQMGPAEAGPIKQRNGNPRRAGAPAHGADKRVNKIELERRNPGIKQCLRLAECAGADAALAFPFYSNEHLKAIFGHFIGELGCPFDAGNPITFHNLVEGKVFQLISVFQAVKIEMVQRDAAAFVGNHQVEGGAGNRHGNAQCRRQPLGEVGLPSTQIAIEGYHRAGLNQPGKRRSYLLRFPY